MGERDSIYPEVGQIVLYDGKRIGKIVLLQEPDNYGIKFDNSEWSVNLDFFLIAHGDSITVLPEDEYMENKCENCVFCKTNTNKFLPNNWVCDNAHSKWYSY